MQHVNPDMDDIFKHAADKYPLKTNTADWESLSQKLYAEENNVESDVDNKGIYNKRKWALFFLLLIIPVVFKVYEKQTQTVAKVKEKQLKLSPADETVNATNKNKTDKEVNTEVAGKDIYRQRNDNITTMVKNNEVTKQKESVSVPSIILKDEIDEQNNLSRSYLPDHLNNDLLKNKSVTMPENKNGKLSESVENTNKTVGAKNVVNQKNSKQTNSKTKRFYVGAVIAPEFTNVKFQPVKRIGFNLGVLMGYDFSDKIALELGATLAHKYYYTSGKYIAPNSIRRDNSKILNVDAFNSITEIPLTLRYNIKKEKNTGFFASAGSVSYIIHKEHYNYTYTKNGEQKQSIKYNNKASNNWFSNVQVSIGYEHAVNKIGKIRIEPYYRIPLQGIGISNLPVTSVGINFAFTKNLK
jgi:hypothetical protein